MHSANRCGQATEAEVTTCEQRIKEAAERAKHELSSCTCTEVNLPFVAADESGPRHLVMEVTREILQELTADLVERLVEPGADEETV